MILKQHGRQVILLRCCVFAKVNLSAARSLHSIFGDGPLSSQVQLAFGLALLCVPLLPDEIGLSKDALVRAAGDLASGTPGLLDRFPEFIQSHPTTPFVHYCYGLRLKEAGRWTEALRHSRKKQNYLRGAHCPG
jgi:hypothetical protein